MVSSTEILITQWFSEASFTEQIPLPRVFFFLLFLKPEGLRAQEGNPFHNYTEVL